ncbi:hypothetical protein [Pseudokineococcus sp. 1T1Z-3]|uniref:hypothetical protein n=1 Tax=Pseudokineococcus sp. 1T1Z-3 TaxID=3132745 RepID=UPI003097287D
MAEPRRLTTFKRWRLADGVTLAHVRRVVEEAVVPHYRDLSDDVELGLEAADDRTIIAVQRWPSRAARDAAMSGPRFEAWWQAYLPVLARWDELVSLVDEWETEVLL